MTEPVLIPIISRYLKVANRLIQLRKPTTALDRVTRHVVFVHGLNGSFGGTWISAGEPVECWPDWLNGNDGTIAVWGVDYGATALKWQSGNSMPLPDRASSLLPLLSSESALASRNIILVGYSLGGLVIKQILRIANDRKGSNLSVASFLRRVRRIAFIATPHLGADLAFKAKTLKWLLREPVLDLPRNDAQLRDLNDWYRNYCDENEVQTLALWESKESVYPILNGSVKINVGQIVKPDSANPGVTRCEVVPIDADHFTIVRPVNRNSPVFDRVKKFVERPFPEEPHGGPAAPVPGAPPSPELKVESPLVTALLIARVEALRQSRYALGFDAVNECKNLMQSVEEEMLLASSEARQIAAAWCARIASAKDANLASKFLKQAVALGNGDEAQIARAFISYFSDGNRDSAIAMITEIGTPMARSACIILACHGQTPEESLRAITEIGTEFDDLDPDGKHAVLKVHTEAERWEEGLTLVQSISDSDYEHTPALFVVAGSLLLASTVNADFRISLLGGPPTELGQFPAYGDAAAIQQRRKARSLFLQGQQAFIRLKQDRMANVAGDYALGLGLLDSMTRDAALKELKESMADSQNALRHLPLAIQYNLDLDLAAIEDELSRQELEEESSPDIAIARLAIAKTLRTPAEAVSYIECYKSQLTELYRPEYIESIQIELLAQSGQLEEARTRFESLSPKLPERPRQSLERIIEEAAGADPAVIREDQYEKTRLTPDLLQLVEVLRVRHEWSKLVRYGKELFDVARNVSSLEAYVEALHWVRDDVKIIELANSVPEMFSTDLLVQFLAWAYFRNGDLDETRRTLRQLQAPDPDANSRALAINLSLVSGDWISLNALVEYEWANREKRNARELLGAGQLAQSVGSARSRELVRAAADKADGDPEILAACYGAATAEGWESDLEVHSWLETAIESSDEGGPIKRVNLREFMNLQPGWHKRVSQTLEELSAGRLPVFGAAHIVRRSLLDMFLIPALANLEEADPRQRGVVFAYSGVRPQLQLRARSVAIDASAIMTLAFIGLLDQVVDYFERVLVPHGLLRWLFEERQRIQFHQPSRVRAALDLKRLLDTGQLERFTGKPKVDEKLEREAGLDLALLIAAAEADTHEKPSVVIRPYPVPRVGTLMEENADLSGHEERLAGCGDVIVALKHAGQLTVTEERQANAYLGMQERPWPHEPTITPGSILYFDELAVRYLQHLKLLERLKPAGFKAIVPESEIADGDALVRQQSFASRANELVESIRKTLADGLVAGNVRLGPLVQDENDALDHPSATFFSLASRVESLLVDDRFLNRHFNMDTGAGLTPIFSTLDLLATMRTDGRISDDRYGEAITQLRRAGYALVPATEGELVERLAATEVVESVVEETAELRAIRESYLRVRMTDMVQLPLEAPWLDGWHRSLVGAIRAQWTDGSNIDQAVARSDWLLGLFDIRGWAHRTLSVSGDATEKYRAQLLLLTGLPSASADVRERYWQWLENRLLIKFREENPEEFVVLGSMVEGFIKNSIDQLEIDREEE